MNIVQHAAHDVIIIIIILLLLLLFMNYWLPSLVVILSVDGL